MKALLLILALAFSVSAQTTDYDKFTDTSIFTTKRVQVYRNKGGLLVYSPAAVALQVVRTTASNDYTLWLDVDSYDWQFTQGCSIRILADGKRYEYPCKTERSHAYSMRYSVYVNEFLGVRIRAADFNAHYSLSINNGYPHVGRASHGRRNF
jgi:hypothetical protein